MPQSIYFGKPDAATRNAEQFRQAVVDGLLFPSMTFGTRTKVMNDKEIETALQGRLILTWRERESYARAQQLYPYAKNVIMPDVAFHLGPYNATKTNSHSRSSMTAPQAPVDVLFFLRNDVESLYTNFRDRHSIRQLLSQSSRTTTSRFTYSIVDWSDRLDRFESNDYYFTDTAIQLLHLGKILICDRLHAAILAYLSGIPFVFVDQVSGKITKTFRVAMQQQQGDHDCAQPAMWDRADNLTDAVTKATIFWEQLYHHGG